VAFRLRSRGAVLLRQIRHLQFARGTGVIVRAQGDHLGHVFVAGDHLDALDFHVEAEDAMLVGTHIPAFPLNHLSALL
jgi:hypothetical protein